MDKVASGADHCGLIDIKRSGESPFRMCLRLKPSLATQLYASCKYDVCSYYQDETQKMDAVCRAYENLAAECADVGTFEWRSKITCRTFSYFE